MLRQCSTTGGTMCVATYVSSRLLITLAKGLGVPLTAVRASVFCADSRNALFLFLTLMLAKQPPPSAQKELWQQAGGSSGRLQSVAWTTSQIQCSFQLMVAQAVT
ncbi:hypothetical protein ABBQ32_007692 [Trebouxia sp. C0010 RCD-2024]